MDTSGPTPDPAAGQPAPSGPAAEPAATPAAPAAPPVDPLAPPARRGLFGARAPATPEQHARIMRGRVRAFGFTFVALGVLLLIQIVPALVAYESLVESGLQDAPGGNLVVQTMPADGNWTITLQTYADGRGFNSSATDAAGRASFRDVPHAVFKLNAVRNGTSITGGLFIPTGENQTLALTPQTQSAKWLNGTPALPQAVGTYLGVLVALLVVAVAGGVAAIVRKWRALALAGAAVTAGGGLAMVLIGGGIGIFQIAMLILGVWAFLTIRRNPQVFAQAAPAPK